MAQDRNQDGGRDRAEKDAIDRWAQQPAHKPGYSHDEGNAESDGGDQGDGQQKKKSPFANPWVKIGLVVAVLLLVAGGIIWWLIARNYEDTDDAFIDTHIIHVSPQVAGQVLAIHVTDNQPVRTGQALVDIDARPQEAALDQALSQRLQAETQIRQAQAQLEAANAQVVNTSRDLARYRTLQATTPQAVAQQQVDQAVASARNANAQRNSALAQVAAARAQIKVLDAQIAELENLIRRALAQNLDLLTAQSRVREARQQEIVAGATGLPQVNASGTYAHLHSGSNPLTRLGGGAGNQGNGDTNGGSDLDLYSLGFDASWEIDVFGQTRRSVEAAAAGTEAARWQMRDGEVSLTAEIAADYVMLRADQARLAILADQEKSQRDTLDLIAAKARTGFVTELDVNQQRQLLSQTVAQRPPLEADILVQRHAIAVLLGLHPGALDAELEAVQSVPPIPPGLPVGWPSDLLRARPDIRMAERKLAQATAEIGVAVADLYPKFDLLAAVNVASNHVSNLFTGQSLSEAGLGSVMLPIFHVAQSCAALSADLVSLYKALGGGWKEAEADRPSQNGNLIFSQ